MTSLLLQVEELRGRRPRGVDISCLVALEREAWLNEYVELSRA